VTHPRGEQAVRLEDSTESLCCHDASDTLLENCITLPANRQVVATVISQEWDRWYYHHSNNLHNFGNAQVLYQTDSILIKHDAHKMYVKCK